MKKLLGSTECDAALNKLSFISKAGYALGIHGIMYFWYAFSLYLFYFYTDVVGLTPAQTGTIFLVSLIWDGITDPLMGFITDRHIARGGRYRPLVLLGGIPFSFSFVAIFYIPTGIDIFYYCLIANLIFRSCWTMTYIPYTSMLTHITNDSRERANIGGFKTIFISLAKLPISFFVLSSVALLGAGDEAKGFLYTTSIIAVMGALSFIGCYLLTPENDSHNSGDKSPVKLSFSQIVSYFRNNSQFWLVLAAMFFGSAAFSLVMQITIYYFKYNLGDQSAAKMAFTAIAVGGLLGTLFWMKVISRLGSSRVWLLGCCLGAAALLILYFYPNPSLWFITAIYSFVAAGTFGFLMTFLPMTADTVDYGELKSGYRVEAFTFGFLSLANKLAAGFSGWLAGMLLTWIEFFPNAEQSVDTLLGLKGILTIVPLIGLVISALVISRYKISTKYHKYILEKLKVSRNK